MKVLLVSATDFEILPTVQWLKTQFKQKEESVFVHHNMEVTCLVTGVGMPNTTFALGHFFAGNKPDFAINAGIAGAIGPTLQKTGVYHVITERFADLGVEESDGRFTNIFDMGLQENEKFLFSEDGRMENHQAGLFGFLPPVHGISVNKVHGYAPHINALTQKYPDAQVETMEGAAFFMACLKANIPFVEIRAISNFVEPRNRENWDIAGAINNLNITLEKIFELLQKQIHSVGSITS